MTASEEIYGKVVRVLGETLNVDEDEVTPSATLQGDLGAESIDFLDLVFRLEREFDIRIPRGELFPESIFQGDPEFVQNGVVTARGLQELRDRMPFADLGPLEDGLRVSAVPDLFTVGMVTRYVAWKLNQGPKGSTTVREFEKAQAPKQ
jgi:acyl carrier protein